MREQIQLKIDSEITLREIRLDDAVTIFNIIDNQREYLGKWLPFVEHTKDATFTEKFIENYLKSETPNKNFVILFNNTLVGLIGLKDTDIANKKTEIGYWLSEKYQGKGIITKSCVGLINYAFEKIDMNRIQLKVAVGNDCSQRVAERLNFTFEGIERAGELHSHGYMDLQVNSLLKKDLV